MVTKRYLAYRYSYGDFSTSGKFYLRKEDAAIESRGIYVAEVIVELVPMSFEKAMLDFAKGRTIVPVNNESIQISLKGMFDGEKTSTSFTLDSSQEYYVL